MAMRNFADVGKVSDGNDANREALRAHIPILVSVLQQHFSIAEVTEAGLVTVVCIVSILHDSLFQSNIESNKEVNCYSMII